MKSFRINLSLIAVPLLVGGYMVINISVAEGRRLPRALTGREMFSRGAIREQAQRTREKLRQLRTQEARMPRDIRAMSPLTVGRPGEARPEIIDYLGRDRTRFIAGGWMWNSGSVSTYPELGLTGPAKGSSYSFGDMVEYGVTDPEGVTIQREAPIVEWWEISERSREQRAEFFRARFGAAQQLQVTPTGEGELRQPGEMGISPPGGGAMPGGMGPPGGAGLPTEEEGLPQLGEQEIGLPDILGMMTDEGSPVKGVPEEDLF